MRVIPFTFALLAIAGIIAAMVAFGKHIAGAPERSARERIKQSIAHAKVNDGVTIWIGNDRVDMDEFVKHRDKFADLHPVALNVEYCRNTDAFLKQIAGLPNVRELLLGKNDVTDAGMEYVATLPDLEILTLYEVNVTDLGLEQLAQSTKLQELRFSPIDNKNVTIKAIVALPYLRKLKLYEPYQGDWLIRDFTDFEQAQALTALTLIGNLSAEKLQSLRDKLPNCKIVVQKVDK